MSGIMIALLFLIAFFGTQLAIEANERNRREQATLQESRQHAEYLARQRQLAKDFARGINDPIQYPVHQMTRRIQEDEPGWDCTTMGNKQCGTVRAKGIRK